jgi:hypothetical protein
MMEFGPLDEERGLKCQAISKKRELDSLPQEPVGIPIKRHINSKDELAKSSRRLPEHSTDVVVYPDA